MAPNKRTTFRDTGKAQSATKPAAKPAQAAAAPKPELADLRTRALAAEAAADWSAALAIWADARKHHPLDRTGWIHGAMAHARSANINAGLALIDDAAKRFPGDAAVIAARGHIIDMRGDAAASAAAWQSVRAKAPQAPDGWVRGAMLLADAGKLDAALALLDDAAKRLPGNGQVLTARGYVIARRGDDAATAAAWQAARAAAPEIPDGWIHGAFAVLRAGDPAVAEAILADAVSRMPGRYAVLAAHANLAERRGDSDAAFTRWRRAADAAPGSQEAIKGMESNSPKHGA